MNGRYSLNEQGLVYANNSNFGFDPSRYTKFPADADGIIPITDESWFEDDAAERVREFVKVVWGAETLVENMEWLADSLGRKAGESADDAIRRYLSASFYKDHLQTYKKRPIYWLFSSGKQRPSSAWCTCIAIMRARSRVCVWSTSCPCKAACRPVSTSLPMTSTAPPAAPNKSPAKAQRQAHQTTRRAPPLRRKPTPYADQRITLDLDDGVKVNYGKFGNLLAEVKAIAGGKED